MADDRGVFVGNCNAIAHVRRRMQIRIQADVIDAVDVVFQSTQRKPHINIDKILIAFSWTTIDGLHRRTDGRPCDSFDSFITDDDDSRFV